MHQPEPYSFFNRLQEIRDRSFENQRNRASRLNLGLGEQFNTMLGSSHHPYWTVNV